MTRLIIDGDGLIYSFAQLAQRAVDWGSNMSSVYCDVALAKKNITEAIAKYQEISGAEKTIIGLSDESRHYFRKDIYPDYKGNRITAGVPTPGFGALRSWLVVEFQTLEIPTLEGDDVIGILATQHRKSFGQNAFIVSVDKDLKQIPCRLINPMKIDEPPEEITPDAAERLLWHQVLMGDRVDGYPGCSGIGAVKAARIVESAADLPTAVWEAYKAAGHDKQYLEQMVNCARILTVETFDTSTKKPILWTAPDNLK